MIPNLYESLAGLRNLARIGRKLVRFTWSLLALAALATIYCLLTDD